MAYPQAAEHMLQVRLASGEMAATVPLGEVSTARALKEHLQRVCGVTRFRQRLLHDGKILADDACLEGPLDLQLVLLNFITALPAERDQLQSASGWGEKARVERILQKPQDPNRHADDRLGSLHVASARGMLGTMRLLLEARADLEDVETTCGQTALSLSAVFGRVDALRFLLSSGANIEARSRHGGTALCEAAQNDQPSCVQVLLDAGAEEDSADATGVTPLGAACRHRAVRVVRLLLAHRANPAARCLLGVSHHQATPRGRGRLQILRMLSKYKWSRKIAGDLGILPSRLPHNYDYVLCFFAATKSLRQIGQFDKESFKIDSIL